jgi:hypothetical protein
MKSSNTLEAVVRRLVGILCLVACLSAVDVVAALEQTFNLFQVGTTTYRNVTVTTKDKNYVFILHSAGMTNIKVADLTPELRAKLGYEDPAAAPAPSKTPTAWAKQTFSKLEVPKVKNLEAQVAGLWTPNAIRAKLPLQEINPSALWAIVGLVLAAYLFHSYCCLLICRKSGSEPGPLIWVPVLQLFPLLKAASMSPWWFLAFLVPGINLIAQVVWFFKIAQARGKGLGIALLLVFPLTCPFAMLYLAFSGGNPRIKPRSRPMGIMTLGTA